MRRKHKVDEEPEEWEEEDEVEEGQAKCLKPIEVEILKNH